MAGTADAVVIVAEAGGLEALAESGASPGTPRETVLLPVRFHFHRGCERVLTLPPVRYRKMSELQTTLGEGDGIAEELAESQRAISIAEFFEKNKHMLGFDSGARALVTAVKEAVDNALDAAEEADIVPDVRVEIREVGDYYRLIVEDNGPGITEESLPKVFGKLLYGSRFHKREQNRGQQGIGISAAVLYSQLTSGKPAKVTSRTKGSDVAQYYELVIDTDDNEPEIREAETLSPADSDLGPTHGTRIVLEMEANMRARKRLHEYMQNTAVVNPHARIHLKEPKTDGWVDFDRVEGVDLPAETEEIRPHPHGVELGTLLKMLDDTSSHSVSGFLRSEFTRVGQKSAAGIVEQFRDRHFGREMAWSPPRKHDDADVEAAVRGAVRNKGSDATKAFARYVARGTDYEDDGESHHLTGLHERDRAAHHEVRAVVDEAADVVAREFDATFGGTVREKAAAAAWGALTDDRTADLYALVDAATTKKKDDATVRGLAERVAAKFRDGAAGAGGSASGGGSGSASSSGGGDRDRATRETLRSYVDRAAKMTEERDEATVGETARENVVEELWAAMRTVPDEVPKVSSVAGDRDAASDLLEAMRETDVMAPPTDCLSPITAELVEAGLRKEFDADFYAAATRDADVHGGDPFIVEAGIAYGGDLDDEGTVDVLRFANRVPLVYQRGACATTDVVKTIGWRNYGLDQPGGSGLPQGPAVVMVHVASTNVPFTSESKDAVANVPAIEDEIELAIREAARELKSYLNKRRSLEKRRRKQDVIAAILPEMAEKLGEVVGDEPPDYDDALARIMNNVLVERRVEEGSVELVVENHTDRGESVEVTDIVDSEPTGLSDGATAVEMDGEWFVQWSPEVGSGEEATLSYETDPDASFDVANVEGVEDARLTNDT